MKALFFGTSAFATPSLHVLAARSDVIGVVTQPDRPSGRGQRVAPTPIKSAALALGLRVYEPQRMKDFSEQIGANTCDLFVLASYGRILPQGLLDIPRLGALNVHPSLLPKYRGATPIQSALRNGDRETGVSIMLMDAGMDTGDIVLQETVGIDPGETYGELHDRLAFYGGELLGQALDLAEGNGLVGMPQQGDVSVTRPIGKDDLTIDWSWSAERIVNTIRAFAPAPAARATIDGESVKLLRAHIDGGQVVIDELVAPNRGRMSGEAYRRSRRDKESVS